MPRTDARASRPPLSFVGPKTVNPMNMKVLPFHLPAALLLAGLLAFTLPVAAADGPAWRLDAGASSLHFVSIKNDVLAEVHAFTAYAGRVSPKGVVRVEVSLASAETGIPVRDERLQTLLFDTPTFATATVTMTIDAQAAAALEVGEAETIASAATIDLHGQSATVPVRVRVTRIAAGRWLASSEQPVLIGAAAFGLAPGIEALREIAGLKNIAQAVPVTFAFVFEAE